MTESGKQLQTILIGVDIEKTGKMLMKHPVVSVGFVVCNDKAILLDSKRFNFDITWKMESEGGDFEDRCWTEFWSKLPDAVIDAFKADVMTQVEGWRAVAVWLDRLEQTYPPAEYKIMFVNDNPSFDIANIDYNLELHADRHPMRYTSSGQYRTITTVDDAFYMFPRSAIGQIKADINKVVKHDHNPVNDAYFMCQQYWHVNKLLKTMITDDAYCAFRYDGSDILDFMPIY